MLMMMMPARLPACRSLGVRRSGGGFTAWLGPLTRMRKVYASDSRPVPCMASRSTCICRVHVMRELRFGQIVLATIVCRAAGLRVLVVPCSPPGHAAEPQLGFVCAIKAAFRPACCLQFLHFLQESRCCLSHTAGAGCGGTHAHEAKTRLDIELQQAPAAQSGRPG